MDRPTSRLGRIKRTAAGVYRRARSVLRFVTAAVAVTLLTAPASAVSTGGVSTGTETPGAGGQPAATLRVVATTGMVGDAARRVGGSRVAVIDLMGEGVDPHLYKASPGDVRTLSAADVVFYNGLHLEGRLGDVLERLGKRTRTVAIAEAIEPERLRTPPEFEGHPDPHVWFDPRLWSTAVERVRDALIAADSAGADTYRANSDAYLKDLHDLDQWIRAELATIPRERRVLVTAHDAFGYFGRAYDIEVLAVQGISTDSEASLRDVNALVDTLVARRIPAVFVESSVPRKTIEALVEGSKARGHRVRIGGELYSDALGKAGTPEGTLVGVLKHNVAAIAGALRGDDPASPGSGAAASGAASSGAVSSQEKPEAPAVR